MKRQESIPKESNRSPQMEESRALARATQGRAAPFFSLLGLQINKLSGCDLVRVVTDAVQAGRKSVIANHNLHSLYLWYHEPKMRAFYAAADFIHIDGMSLICLGNVLGLPLKRRDRTTFLDLFPLLLEQTVEQDWRIFYLGSKPGVTERAAAVLRERYPTLQIQAHHGHFNPDRAGEENQRILKQINAYAPHILFVGMGMPRQENWILENRNSLTVNAILPAGALMDYLAGEIPTPPRWLGSLYLEWLYRLLSEPTRLWRRYLVEPWFVLGQVLRSQVKFRSRTEAGQDTGGD
jgi:N-acetylglucosaminyldiphosphoundecaprenol N-acetyl-beta-D-mannosaminyltransferase